MTFSQPKLVQRAQVRREDLPDVGYFSKELLLEFMGPQEYKVNVPISLRSIQNRFDKYQIDERIIPHAGHNLQLFHSFSEDELSQYTVWLFDLRIGRLETFVRSNFKVCLPQHNTGTDFWWDLENHCMWSFNKPFMNKLQSYLTSEFQKMDETRARRQLGGLA